MNFCAKCGAKATETQKFCFGCGQKIDNAKTTKSNESPKEIGNNVNRDEDNKVYATKKQIKLNKKIFIPIGIVGLIVVGLVSAKVYFSKAYTPQKIVSKFQTAVVNNDIETLKNMLYTSDSSFEIEDEDVQAVARYLNEGKNKLTTVIDELNKDSYMSSYLTSKGTPVLLKDNRLFALTVTNKNFLFTKYGVIVKPVYADVTTNSFESNISVGEKDFGLIEVDTDFKTIGPFLPGTYDITAKTKGPIEEITETISTEFNHLGEVNEIEFFEEYDSVIVKSNFQDSKIFINGKDSGVLVKDIKDSFGPIKTGDIIHSSHTVDGKEYKSREYTYGYYGSINLNFTSSDLKILQSNNTNTTATNIDEYITKYKDRDYIIADSNTVKLDFKKLNDYNAEELFIARNEMFARNGYVFKSSPNLQKFFESKAWYKANESYEPNLSGEIEAHNLGYIKSIEFMKMADDKNPTITSDYVVQNSNTVEMTVDAVKKLNDWELLMAKNEIYARYGLEFSTKEVMDHFKSKSWFVIDSSVGNNMSLNEVENKNIAIMVAEENARMEKALNHDLGA